MNFEVEIIADEVHLTMSAPPISYKRKYFDLTPSPE
jgi:hypothetical protein